MAAMAARRPSAVFAGSLAEIDPLRDPRWDTFVGRHGTAPAHAYHAGTWSEILRRAYGAELVYLAAANAGGDLVAALPLVAERGLLRGGRLSSLMLALRGGPIAVDDESRATVIESACRLARERGARSFLMTTEAAGCERLVSHLQVLPHAPTWVTPLPDDPDKLRQTWRKRSKNLSRNLKRAEDAGNVVREARSRADVWRFYRLYAQTMRGHRVMPRSWLEIHLAHKLLAPSGGCRLWLAEHDGEVVAGAMFLVAGHTLELLYAGSDPRALDARPNHAIYWHAVEWGIAYGVTSLDWGPAPPDSSLGKFKSQWSADPVPVFRYLYEPGAADVPAASDRDDAAARGDGHTMGREGVLARAWDRVPASALGLAATAAHRVL
jgi:CelD/BcsL family acetyltransferase involved in cellulose biosynthesis